jgi:hypothetical protein
MSFRDELKKSEKFSYWFTVKDKNRPGNAFEMAGCEAAFALLYIRKCCFPEALGSERPGLHSQFQFCNNWWNNEYDNRPYNLNKRYYPSGYNPVGNQYVGCRLDFVLKRNVKLLAIIGNETATAYICFLGVLNKYFDEHRRRGQTRGSPGELCNVLIKSIRALLAEPLTSINRESKR